MTVINIGYYNEISAHDVGQKQFVGSGMPIIKPAGSFSDRRSIYFAFISF